MGRAAQQLAQGVGHVLLRRLHGGDLLAQGLVLAAQGFEAAREFAEAGLGVAGQAVQPAGEILLPLPKLPGAAETGQGQQQGEDADDDTQAGGARWPGRSRFDRFRFGGRRCFRFG